MITITEKDLESADEEIKLLAQKIAYENSEPIADRTLQTIIFNLARDYIICGARLMEEYIMNLKPNE